MRETKLEMATRHVLEGATIVRRQQAPVAELRMDGHDTTLAEGLLVELVRSLELHCAQLAGLTGEPPENSN